MHKLVFGCCATRLLKLCDFAGPSERTKWFRVRTRSTRANDLCGAGCHRGKCTRIRLAASDDIVDQVVAVLHIARPAIASVPTCRCWYRSRTKFLCCNTECPIAPIAWFCQGTSGCGAETGPTCLFAVVVCWSWLAAKRQRLHPGFA